MSPLFFESAPSAPHDRFSRETLRAAESWRETNGIGERNADCEGSAPAASKKWLGEVGEVFGECVAEFDELGRDRFVGVVVERPLLEQSEERGSLGGVELDICGGADGFECGAEVRGALYVLQSGNERLARVPADGDVAAAERNGDGVEAFGHAREATT